MPEDISDKIAFFGTAVSRGAEARRWLEANGDPAFPLTQSVVFKHNDITLEVFRDSTDREIAWQYEFKSFKARVAKRQDI